MKITIRKFLITVFILSVLSIHSTASAGYTPEFSDELSRIGIRVEPDEPGAMEILSASGVNTIRYALNWHKFEPQKEQWDTEYVESRIAVLKNTNIKSMIGIGVNNELYSGNSDIRYGIETKANLDGFSSYCRKLAEYLSQNYPEIKTFLIWNEPNSSSFWRNEPNPSSYCNLVKEASLAFKKVIPDCTIIAGVTANPSLLFLDQIYELGIYQYADVISFQPYVMPANADGGTLTYRFKEYNSVIDKYGSWKDTYVSEIGWCTYAENNTNGVSEESQASNIVKSFVLADEYDISGVNIYELVDGTGNSVESENHFGLVNSDYSTKKGYEALVHYQDTIGGADYSGKLISSDGNSFAYIYHKNGKILAVAWTKNDTDSLSSLNITKYSNASNLYGQSLEAVTLSQTPIYIEINDENVLYSALESSIKGYYNDIPDLYRSETLDELANFDISGITADDIRCKFEENYKLASDLVDSYASKADSANLEACLTSINKLHKAGLKWGVLCAYTFQNEPVLQEISSNDTILSTQDILKKPIQNVNFEVKCKGAQIGDTITLLVSNEYGLPAYTGQKTIGSGVEQTISFSLNIEETSTYSGKISSLSSNAVIESITSDNPRCSITFNGNDFSVTCINTIDAELKNFDHTFPYANAILKQAKKYNLRANTLKNSQYDSVTKGSSIEISDYISNQLSKLSVKVAILEEASFDEGFSIVTTPSIIKTSGTTQVSAEITNRNAVDFNGSVELSDNLGNTLSTFDISVPADSTVTVDFNVIISETAATGQYFYYLSMVDNNTIISSKSIFINTQIGPYSDYEMSDNNHIATTPAENKFTLNGKEYILIDTTDDNNSKFFVMEEDISETRYFDDDKYDIKFDTTDTNNIAYYLNNTYSIDPDIKKYINFNHTWLTEAGYGDSVIPTDYTVKCGVSLLSVQEWIAYAGRFGYAPFGSSVNTWWMRTPGTNLDTIRYVSTLTGKNLHTFTNSELRGIRPVYYLNHNFFKEVKVDSWGSNVLKTISQNYSPHELLSGGAYTKADLISMGIASEEDFLFSEITLTDALGNNINSPENQQEINLNLLYGGDKDFAVILAIYDSQNMLISCAHKEIENKTNIKITLSAAAPKGSYAKCFLLETSSLRPLSKPLLFC